MTIGDTVYVRWYGNIVECMIVENNKVAPAKPKPRKEVNVSQLSFWE